MRPFILTIILFLSAGISRQALGCKCAPPPEPVAALEKATAVFVGQVKEIKPHPNGMSLQVHLDVFNRFKGKLGKHALVNTARDGATCGFHFVSGKQYLVYTFGEKELHTNLCQRTKLLTKQAQAEVLALEAHAAESNLNAQD